MAAPFETDLDLPEQDFTYLAGSQDRPWEHFVGRWEAIRPRLSEILARCGTDRPLRVLDVGSCRGYFSLQAAHRHPEADVVGIEGSVGVGNGGAGMQGSVRQILWTPAVQMHLRWIQRAALPNCFVAPEVWDYTRVCSLASGGRPICDAMFLLSVVHHIDSISTRQYEDAGLSRADGTVDLLAKLLLLSPYHFVELPNRPWMAAAYDKYHTHRGILNAAVKASGRAWRFRGPIYQSEWFGQRELLIIEATEEFGTVDVQECPFPLLYRGDEPDVKDDVQVEDVGLGPKDSLPGLQVGAAGADVYQGELAGFEGEDDLLIGAELQVATRRAQRGLVIDPGLMLLAGSGEVRCPPSEDRIGHALSRAPTDLLLAHLALRDAVSEAQLRLQEHRAVMAAERAADAALGRGAPGDALVGPEARGRALLA